MLVGLLEVSGRHPGAEDEPSLVRDLLAGEEPEEMALASAVVAEHRDPFAERHLEIERPDQTGDRELIARHHANAGATPTQADADVLPAWSLSWWAGLLEFAESRDRRLKTARHGVAHRRLDAHPAYQVLEVV